MIMLMKFYKPTSICPILVIMIINHSSIDNDAYGNPYILLPCFIFEIIIVILVKKIHDHDYENMGVHILLDFNSKLLQTSINPLKYF